MQYALPANESQNTHTNVQQTLDLLKHVHRRLETPRDPALPGRVSETGIRYIVERYKEPITLDQIANATHKSKFHLLRRFRQETGITPGRFLKRLRIAHAMELLGQDHLSIGQIARDVGYRNQAAFTRAFHSVAGITPRQFRNCRRARAAR